MVYGFAPLGFQGELVRIEVDLRRGIPGMEIIGLANQAVQEARERVRIAVRQSGYSLWEGRVLFSLAPADLRKNGGGYDLALAIALLQASGQLTKVSQPLLAVGELSLDGRVRPVPGVLGAALLAAERGVGHLLVPEEQLPEAASVPGLRVWGVATLGSLTRILSDLEDGVEPALPSFEASDHRRRTPGFAARGPQVRALSLAAAGGHHLLLVGPPGTGKTLAARSLAALLPPPNPEEERDINRVASLLGEWRPEVGWIRTRPVRFVSPGATREGLCGGSDLVPGEVTRSHAGILVLDEVLEFSSGVLQSLRHPAQEGEVFIVRAGHSYRYPARFQMVLTANPCPCGRLGLAEATCLCSRQEVHQYWKTLGGPLLDRVDLRHWCSPLTPDALIASAPPDPVALRSRVIQAHQRQRARNPEGKLNARLDLEEVQMVVDLGPEARGAWVVGGRRWGWSGRASLGILKVARTIADLEDRDEVRVEDLEEAAGLRLYGELGWGREHLDIPRYLG